MGEKNRREHFIVDGYNLIYAADDLTAMFKGDNANLPSGDGLAAARDKLIHMVSEYGAFEQYEVTIVFDAPNTYDEEQVQEVGEHCRVIYTKAGESADSRIERLTYELARAKQTVHVVSSDGTIESVILGAGGYRIPSREFMSAMRRAKKELRRDYLADVTLPLARHDVSTRLDSATLMALDKLRRGKD